MKHQVSSHPVHLVNENGTPSQTAFIPFCDFGGNITIMGTKIKELDIPVCTSFKEKFHKNQLCYEVDVNQFSSRVDPKAILKFGLSFMVDTNDNRQTKDHGEETDLIKLTNIGKNTTCFLLELNVSYYSKPVCSRRR